jgi:hypothetical protein
MSKHLDTTVGGIIVGATLNGINSFVNNSKENVSFMRMDSTKGTSHSDDSKHYIVRIKMGVPPTRTVRQAANQHGSSIVEISNSIKTSLNSSIRKELFNAFGFNQKSYDFLGSNFHIQVKDYDPFYKFSRYEDDINSVTIPYGLSLEEFINIKLRNSNTYHDMKIKIHVVKILDDDVSLSILFNFIINDKKGQQDSGSIPSVYQVSDKIKGNLMNRVLCVPGASLSYSSLFKTHAKVVKTVSKRLSPGDILDFRFTNMCGPGVRLDVGKTYMTKGSKGEQPSSFAFIVEAGGLDCEAIRIMDKSRFIGTAPGWYNYEFKKSLRLVTYNTVTDSDNLLGTTNPKYAIKVHDRRLLNEVPYNVDSSKIGDIDDKNKELSIVSTSLEHVGMSAPIGGTSKEKSPNLVIEQITDNIIRAVPGDESIDVIDPDEVIDEDLTEEF